MGRVINPETAGKDRTRLTRSIVLAVRELLHQGDTDAAARDLAAYVALALEEVAGTIDPSVEAWEKRGYWVKADRFRMEWDWARRLGDGIRQAVLKDDWANVAQLAVQVAVKLKDVKVPVRHRLGTPWVGAFAHLQSKAAGASR